MEVHEVIRDLMTTLSRLSKEKVFLGVSLQEFEDSWPVEVEGPLEKCDPLPSFSYLDTSSRYMTVRGANIYLASLYANIEGEHMTVPLNASLPFLAIKGSRDVVEMIETSPLSKVVRTRNVNDIPYDPGYKDDNILDELRIYLENRAIERARIAVVDGPVFPGPYLPMVGEPYRSAYERLIQGRRKDQLVGVVKRLSTSRKLSRVKDLWKGDVTPTDDVLTLELGKGKITYVTPVLREEFQLSNSSLQRYMVYVKVRDSVFRVESPSKDLLCQGVATSLVHASYRGLPTFIEVADRLSRKLSASTFILSFIYAKGQVEVTYDDWNRFQQANLDLEMG
ncbi:MULTISPECIES: DNA double-strand break repair nuclease NurA [Metallosphaera]|uniref:DNA double-strand break repair nuclease NurA n=1 Tax=Metallosphaera TaxID=41980 RepID=UPI001F063FCF|nr:DNA double-strand break repair nuclease NurA [Metallosphaera sedula]MCH1772156.1 DNA double-strand break repair nuclease NurA [Metallosphaera sedula]MCP6727701.1 DNA double-strand break repair nuclease NurA [Metallosphaera sedula]